MHYHQKLSAKNSRKKNAYRSIVLSVLKNTKSEKSSIAKLYIWGKKIF
jgi:hypothetical protein